MKNPTQNPFFLAFTAMIIAIGISVCMLPLVYGYLADNSYASVFYVFSAWHTLSRPLIMAIGLHVIIANLMPVLYMAGLNVKRQKPSAFIPFFISILMWVGMLVYFGTFGAMNMACSIAVAVLCTAQVCVLYAFYGSIKARLQVAV